MSESIAVAIVHGSGQKDPDFADEIIDKLERMFPALLPPEKREDANLEIEPVYWADLPREREEDIWQRVRDSGPMDQLGLRRYIFNLAGDTLAYQPSQGRRDLYVAVHEVMAEAFEKLADRAGPEAPLCVLSHSMGTIVTHNYLYDMQDGTEGVIVDDEAESALPQPETPLERGETLSLFVTYGSPLAIWRLRFGDDYKSIRFPGSAAEELYPELEPRWLNVYDADDVIGYPISQLTDSYAEMAEEGYLEDRQRNVGAFWKSWNPLSHKGYFRHDDSLEELAGYLAGVWQGAFGEGTGQRERGEAPSEEDSSIVPDVLGKLAGKSRSAPEDDSA
jgi:pimeloyl-ACP methyl ester carboxylesterase